MHWAQQGRENAHSHTLWNYGGAALYISVTPFFIFFYESAHHSLSRNFKEKSANKDASHDIHVMSADLFFKLHTMK